MLRLLQTLAIQLRPLAPLALAVFAVGVVAFAALVIRGAPDRHLAGALLAAIWGGWWLTLLTAFGRAPAEPWHAGSLRARLRRRLARAGYLTMAWLLVASGLAAALLSVRLLMLDASP